MGGGPATADVVRSSCFVTFPERSHAEPVPVDAWYLFAAGLTFLRRLARDRVGDEMHVALVLQLPTNNDRSERRYASVSSTRVLQRALQATFDCPDKALVLHVIDVGKVRGQKRIHVRPEANANVSPEPVEALALVFPTLSLVDIETPTAVEVPTAHMTQESFYDRVSRSRRRNYRKDDSVWWQTEARGDDGVDERVKSWRKVGGYSIEERDYTKREKGGEQLEKTVETDEASGRSVEENKCGDERLADENEVPLATIVETASTAELIPSDYVMLELQTGAGLPEATGMASSTYFISSRWAEQADEMSASMMLERPPLVPRASRGGGVSSDDRRSSRAAALEDSFVVLERHEL